MPSFLPSSQGRLIGIATRLGGGWSRVRLPVWIRNVFTDRLLGLPNFLFNGYRGSISGVKWPRRDAGYTLLRSADVKKIWAIPLLPYMSSWCEQRPRYLHVFPRVSLQPNKICLCRKYSAMSVTAFASPLCTFPVSAPFDGNYSHYLYTFFYCFLSAKERRKCWWRPDVDVRFVFIIIIIIIIIIKWKEYLKFCFV
jgi:hypothetical protein